MKVSEEISNQTKKTILQAEDNERREQTNFPVEGIP